jgi:hypothetical protein
LTGGAEGLEFEAVDVRPDAGGEVVALLVLPLLHPAARAARVATQATIAQLR